MHLAPREPPHHTLAGHAATGNSRMLAEHASLNAAET